MNFWQKLPKPFYALAPMDDVTDTVFRRMIIDTAPPDVFYTEFASVDGYMSEGKEAVAKKLQFEEVEKPLIAQVWGLVPGHYHAVATDLAKAGFSGVDINMGCPVPKVIKNGACSALINNRNLAKDIIEATKSGLNGKIPLSVKTRVGFNQVDLTWIEFLLEQKLDALGVHFRTVKEQSKVPADWSLAHEIVKLRNKISPKTILIGNGDVLSKAQGEDLAVETGFEGIMIGRGIFKDPYIFANNSGWENQSKTQKLELYEKHIKLFESTWGEDKNPAVLKKFAKVYVNGFEGASELRSKLMESNSSHDLLKTLKKHK